ncbi:MAG TPA: hypothetical protein VNA25_31000 [Phycisphaerae bacterium]|nr:hypothetical protein [Phycisphaerae bacterium]
MLAANWDTKRILIFVAPFALILIGVLIVLLMRKTLRTRFRMNRQLREDPDIKEWLVVFDWSRKILYVPTVAASLAACVLTAVIANDTTHRIIGGVWFATFFMNFLIDEFEMSVKVLLIVVLLAALLTLWLLFMDWLWPFVRFFRHLGIRMSWIGYLLLAAVFSFAIFMSWLRGLFYYVAITPNYINFQTGPTETGEQISREEYSTRVDTGDFLERLMGFGRIIITFADQRRQPMMLLVSHIGKRAASLESIRGVMTVDMYHSTRPADGFTQD